MRRRNALLVVNVGHWFTSTRSDVQLLHDGGELALSTHQKWLALRRAILLVARAFRKHMHPSGLAVFHGYSPTQGVGDAPCGRCESCVRSRFTR